LKLAKIASNITGILAMTRVNTTISSIEVRLYCLLTCTVAQAITSRLPEAIVIRNQIPKAYLHHDLYCNLIPNDDESSPVFD
jgi:hypothetical protein